MEVMEVCPVWRSFCRRVHGLLLVWHSCVGFGFEVSHSNYYTIIIKGMYTLLCACFMNIMLVMT